MTYIVWKCRMCGVQFSRSSQLNFGNGLDYYAGRNQLVSIHFCREGVQGLADLIAEKETATDEEFENA